MIISYYPEKNEVNSYTLNSREIWSKFGKLENSSIRARGIKSIKSVDICVLNWSENSIIGSNGDLRFIGVAKLFFKLILYKIIAKNLIFVRHNVYPHATAPKYRKVATKIVNFYEMFFDIVIVHSGHYAEGSRKYIPHPLYANSYSSDVFQKKVSLPEKYFLIFGRIERYKKIESVIEKLNDNTNLVICGSCSDQKYLDLLRSYNKKNVFIIPEFVSNEYASYLTKNAVALLISHSDDDMILSGSVIFGISNEVKVLAVETGCINWFVETLKIDNITAVKDIEKLCFEMNQLLKNSYIPLNYSHNKNHFSNDLITEMLKNVLVEKNIVSKNHFLNK